jgi:hypothetical protein
VSGDPVTTFGAAPRRAAASAADLAVDGWARVDHEVRSLAARVTRDLSLARASGRWRAGMPDPDSYVPADAVALRALPVAAGFEDLHRYQHVLTDPWATVGARLEAACRAELLLSDARAVYEAVPHFLDADGADGILTSSPPGPDVLTDLRLPHPRVAVFLGRVLDVACCDWPADWDRTVDLAGHPTTEPTMLGELRARGGGVEGVVLSETPGGGLADDVVWFVSVEPDPTQPDDLARDRFRTLVWGRRSLSHLAGVANNLAAAVAWGEWRQARLVDLPDDLDTKAWRKATRRGEFRRQEPQGAAAGVRVLDLARSPTVGHAPAADRAGSGRASPVTHLRRAHWRSQPVGPGGRDRRLTRVAATVVHPSGTPMRTAVYRVSAPDDPGDADGDTQPHPARITGRNLDVRRIELPIGVPEAPEPRPAGAEVDL